MDLSVGLAHALVQGLVGVDGGLQVDTIQYFLVKLGMNLYRHQEESIIFSLYHVIVRPTNYYGSHKIGHISRKKSISKHFSNTSWCPSLIFFNEKNQKDSSDLQH